MPATSSDTCLLTEKRVATLDALPLACGATLHEVTIGYETYGRLSPSADNAVLICHFFSGSSHAAGRYAPNDAVAGWWDALIGPNKAIDTNRWFVVAIDALGCVRKDAPHGVTTSAASRNPATGEPYGPDFPAIAIADMVESQRRVLASLGVTRLAAVAGPSLGAMQALEWAMRHPGAVDRVIAAIGPAEFQAREIGLYRAMEDAIRLDPAFMGGRYGPQPPQAGMALALKLMMLLTAGREALRLAHPDAESVEAWLDAESRARATLCDANSWITMLRCNMHWRLGGGELAEALAAIRARVLLLPATGDELLPMASYHDPVERHLRESGAEVAVSPLPPRNGHMAGLQDILAAAEAVRACLETERAR